MPTEISSKDIPSIEKIGSIAKSLELISKEKRDVSKAGEIIQGVIDESDCILAKPEKKYLLISDTRTLDPEVVCLVIDELENIGFGTRGDADHELWITW